jgi:hypothetical protein
MKKIILGSMVLFIIFSCSSFAQFKIGPKFGINLASVSHDPEFPQGYDDSGKMGFMFGAALELGIAGPIAIALEPMYVQKGEEISGVFILNTNQGPMQVQGILTNSASYLQIPVLVKAKIPLGVIKPYGFLGPNIGIKLSATQEFEGGGQSIDGDNENVSSIDFGVDFGAGVAFSVIPVMDLTFDIRYSLGFTNVIDQPQQNESAKTRGLQFMIGALFGL